MQLAAISYPHLSKEEIFHSMEVFYKRFYFRPGKIWEIVREMLASWDMTKRRLREGVEFFRFLRAHAGLKAACWHRCRYYIRSLPSLALLAWVSLPATPS